MSVPLEVEEIAVKDYSPEYGTVVQIIPSADTIEIHFFNGTVITPSKGSMLEIDQGGRFDHSPIT